MPEIEGELKTSAKGACTTRHTLRNCRGGSCLSPVNEFAHASPTFVRLLNRLQYLELWRELAIRPKTVDSEDEDLLAMTIDDMQLLRVRCKTTRKLVNANFPEHELAVDNDLEVRPSQIPKAGLGLYYQGAQVVRPGEILCYYYGHLHDPSSVRELEDTSYVQWIQPNVLVDPGPLPNIKARFINDPLNESKVNAKYVPQKWRSAATATREIHPGEEIFCSYGEAYWAQQKVQGNVCI